MAEHDFAVQLQDQIMIPEFQPFRKKELIAFLKAYLMRLEQLRQRQDRLVQLIQDLDHTKTVFGEDLNERIQTYAFGAHGGDGIGGTRYNPDTLFNRWIKIYEPYEAQREMYQNSLYRILYEMWQMECVSRCIDALPAEQRHLVYQVFIQHVKVVTYCKLLQIGHDKYNRLKEDAFDRLLPDCNQKLAELYQTWGKVNAKSDVDDDNSASGRKHHQSVVGL